MVDKWMKKEGDRLKPSDFLCTASVGDMEIAVDGFTGVLSAILVQEGKKGPVGQPIAEYVDTMEEFLEIREAQR